MRVSLSELIDPNLEPTLGFLERSNLGFLHYKINCLRQYCPHPFIIRTPERRRSGFRTKEDHFGLYSEINARRKATGLPDLRVPKKSMHLVGAAADILDREGVIQKWILDNLIRSEEIGLWYEEFDSTPNWVHAQIYPPSSGKRFFKP